MGNLDVSISNAKNLDESFSNVRGGYSKDSLEIKELKSYISHINEYIAPLKEELVGIKISIDEAKAKLPNAIFDFNTAPEVPRQLKKDLNKAIVLLQDNISKNESIMKSLMDSIASKNILIKEAEDKIKALSYFEPLGKVGEKKSFINPLLLKNVKNEVSDDKVESVKKPTEDTIDLSVRNDDSKVISKSYFFNTKNVLIGVVLLSLVGFSLYKTGMLKGLKF